MATKTAAKKSRKSTTKREVFKVARTAGQLAEGIWAREQRTPGYWKTVQECMTLWTSGGTQIRAAQDMPRESATH